MALLSVVDVAVKIIPVRGRKVCFSHHRDLPHPSSHVVLCMSFQWYRWLIEIGYAL